MNRGVEPVHLRLGGSRLCEISTLGILSTDDPHARRHPGRLVAAVPHRPRLRPGGRRSLLVRECEGLYDVAFRSEEEVAAAGLAFQQMRSVQAAGLCRSVAPA
jgi:hypothetical protein